MGRRAGKMLGVGDIAPDFRLARVGGGEESLIAAAPVLVAFFKISCPVCQLTLPFLERLHGMSAQADDLHRPHIYGISQNEEDETREFNEYYGLTFPTLLDREEEDFPASNAFGITHVPTMFRIEPGGRIAQVIEGWNRKEMEQLGAVRTTDNVPAWKAG